MKNSRMVRAAMALGACALLGTACGNDDDSASTTTKADSTTTEAPSSGADRGNVDGMLKIGTLVPQTGDLNTIHDSLATPIELALAEINEAGGVLGNDVELVEGDDGTSATVAQTTYDKLINSDKVDLIIGPAPSGVAAKLADGFGTDRVPACSGSTTAANLQGAGNGYFFRTAPGDDLQGPALAELISGDGHTDVAIIARNDDYGKGFSESLAAALEDSGATVTETVLYNPDSGSGYDADVQKALDSSPDAVAVIGFNDDGAQIVSSLIGKGQGPDVMPTYTADGMQGSSFGETVDPSNPGKVAGMKGTAPAAAPAGIDHPFTAKFAATGVDTIFSSYYYDCTILMALAVEAAESDDGTAVKDAFAANLEGDNDCQTFADCKALLAEGKTIHYRGASSAFDTWNVMQPATGVYDVWQFTDDGSVGEVDGAEQISVP
ncbi:MAG TPA: ABC transporter substrate-binding protein [Microthrixaceae bacterium]|nr:ABC transporter substrate-binding protein [Microthrixaceae bacterium]